MVCPVRTPRSGLCWRPDYFTGMDTVVLPPVSRVTQATVSFDHDDQWALVGAGAVANDADAAPACHPARAEFRIPGGSVGNPARQSFATLSPLWRSDCSVCRQWLQRLAEQPIEHPPELILVNQGESLLSAIRYLDQHPDQRLELEDTSLLLDPRQHLLALTGQRHLPVLLQVAPDNTLTRIHDLSAILARTPQGQ